MLEAVVHAGLGAQVAHRPAAARVACGEQEAHLLRLDAHARRAGPADLWPLRTFHLELEAGPTFLIYKVGTKIGHCFQTEDLVLKF